MTAQLHPDSGRLSDYVLGKLPAADVAELEAHLAACADCQAKAETLDAAGDSFVSCLPGAAKETPADPALERLVAGARDLVGATISYQDATPKHMVAGHEIRKELARGGLGVVYLAYHPLLRDVRAIKRPQIRPELDRGSILARFQREVQAVGALRHDHVIRAHDAGNDADGPYLVMEYLDGQPLSRLVKERGPLPAPQACELIRQAALGLQAAHERGLVHRDIKPSNLMLARVNTGAARVVVIDWGLVKRTAEQPANGVTVAQSVLGTSDYMSPEQHRNAHSVDIRADIYSLGVTFYYLLTGKAPFQGRPDPEKFAAHQSEPFPPLEAKRADVPKEVSAILKKMVEKNPAQRFATPAEVAAALQPFCGAARLIDLLVGSASAPPAPPRRSPVNLMLAATAAAAALLCVASVALGVLIWAVARPDAAKKDDRGQQNAGPLDGPESPVAMDKRHDGLCLSIAITADGNYAISESGGGHLYIWNLKKRSLDKTVGHEMKKTLPNLAGVVAVSPDGRRFAAAGVNAGVEYMNLLRVYDQQTFEPTNTAYPFGRLGYALAYSPDGSKLAAVEIPNILNDLLPLPGKKTIKVLDVKSDGWTRLPTDKNVKHLAISPDNQFLATCNNDKNLRVWNIKSRAIDKEFPGHDGGADQVAFSIDGQRLFSASSADDSLRVWNARDRYDLVRAISMAKLAKMRCCAFWPGGRAVTGHQDGSVVAWDLNKDEPLGRFAHQGVQITAVAVSPDGHHAVAAHSDHSVYLYRLP
jgi:tRNA A-37 threonylcarbamoyl transferase component Bud32